MIVEQDMGKANLRNALALVCIGFGLLSCTTSPYFGGEKFVHQENTFYFLKRDTPENTYYGFMELLPQRKMSSSLDVRAAFIAALEAYTRCDVNPNNIVFTVDPLYSLEAKLDC